MYITFVRDHFAVDVASISLSPTILLRCIYTSTVYAYYITCVRNHFDLRPSSPPVPASSLAPRSEKKQIHTGMNTCRCIYISYVRNHCYRLDFVSSPTVPASSLAPRTEKIIISLYIYTCKCIPSIYYARTCPLRSHYRLHFVLRRRQCLLPPLLRTKSRRSFLGM